MKRLVIGAALALAGSPARAAPPAPDAITLELSSWGKPMVSWRVTGDGKVSLTTTRNKPGGSFLEYTLETRTAAPGPTAFARVRAALAPAEPYAGGLRCRIEVTDQPYGALTWTRAGRTARIDLNYGCRSPDARAVFTAIEQAAALVTDWTDRAPVTRTEPKGAR